MIFLGYRVKIPWDPGPAWAPVESICGMGDDLCEPPEDWTERWDFNRASCYPTPQTAWATVEAHPLRDQFRLFAYEALPLALHDGQEPREASLDELFDPLLPPLPLGPVPPPGMTILGYDVAEAQSAFIGYPWSPLMTNGFAGPEFPPNRLGLLDELPVALGLAARVNAEMPEHAPHWVFRVWGEDPV